MAARSGLQLGHSPPIVRPIPGRKEDGSPFGIATITIITTAMPLWVSERRWQPVRDCNQVMQSQTAKQVNVGKKMAARSGLQHKDPSDLHKSIYRRKEDGSPFGIATQLPDLAMVAAHNVGKKMAARSGLQHYIYASIVER